jgi:hypothetical protein
MINIPRCRPPPTRLSRRVLWILHGRIDEVAQIFATYEGTQSLQASCPRWHRSCLQAASGHSQPKQQPCPPLKANALLRTMPTSNRILPITAYSCRSTSSLMVYDCQIFAEPEDENDRQTEGAEVGLGIQHHASGEDGDDIGDAGKQGPEHTHPGNKTANGLATSITPCHPGQSRSLPAVHSGLTHSPPSPPAGHHRKERGSVAD